MIVPAVTLIAPAATPLRDENWKRIIVIVITIIINFVIELIPFNCLLSRPKESVDLLIKCFIKKYRDTAIPMPTTSIMISFQKFCGSDSGKEDAVFNLIGSSSC